MLLLLAVRSLCAGCMLDNPLKVLSAVVCCNMTIPPQYLPMPCCRCCFNAPQATPEALMP